VLYSLPLDDGLTSYLRSQEVRCVAYIPLLNRNRTIGALGIGSGRFHQFSASQVRFLTSVGHQVGLAIGNARLYEQVKQRAETDPLTLLYNRQRFCELLDQRLAAGRRLLPAFSAAPTLVGAGLPADSRSLAGDGLSPAADAEAAGSDAGAGVWEPFTPEVGPWVLMIDIDNFKQINDTCGHARGDQALREVSHLLRQCVRAGDIVGRFGGDEFVVALCDDNRAGAGTPKGWAAARAVVRRLRRRFAEASAAGEFCVPLTVSIGAARSGTSSEHCLQLADEAMYREKRRRKRKAS
jgi:diguanylate cyclase (GGDEF)-like protein